MTSFAQHDDVIQNLLDPYCVVALAPLQAGYAAAIALYPPPVAAAGVVARPALNAVDDGNTVFHFPTTSVGKGNAAHFIGTIVNTPVPVSRIVFKQSNCS